MSVVTITDLSERPQHADAVAARIWKAFWEPYGTPYRQVRSGLEPFLKAEKPIPFGIVAEIDGQVCGNALVIENDEEARPALTPWIAAVWVDEAARGQGIAAALLEEGLRRCALLGVPKVYLVARPRMQSFYVERGWTALEEGVGKHGLTLYARNTKAS
jgi:GNAT superfamily N-acetyltransferase